MQPLGFIKLREQPSGVTFHVQVSRIDGYCQVSPGRVELHAGNLKLSLEPCTVEQIDAAIEASHALFWRELANTPFRVSVR